MSFGPNFNIWTLGKGARGQWKLQLSTGDIEEAVARFIELNDQGKQVVTYEPGLFLHEGQQIAGQVAFIWTENMNAFMEGEPRGRGQGWADGYDTYVTYIHPDQGTAVAGTDLSDPHEAAALPVPATGYTLPAPEPAERYVEGACEHCGVILPMHQLQRLSREVQVGRSSGSHRTSRSSTSRYSGRSFSNSNTFGSSSSSGRTYYKTETLVLCTECYERQRYADRNVIQVIWDFLNKR